jgi:L-lactate dehydrogenase (cytochrome)
MRERQLSNSRFLTVEDYRLRAKSRLPRVVFDFVDGAAESEQTARDNRAAFEAVALRPRVGLEPAVPDLSTSLFGVDISFPVIVGPAGMTRIVSPDGDCAGARAAGKAGTIFTLATRSGHSIEEIARNASGPLWFQLYNISGRSAAESAVLRAQEAGYKALVLTLDTQVGGSRERDLRNGTGALLGANRVRAMRHTPQLLRHPVWFAKRIADGLLPDTPNVVGPDGSVPRLSTEQRRGNGKRQWLEWSDVSWLRSSWSGPILVKGVLTAEDAQRAIDLGVDGIIISNHGGRQLDCTPSTLSVLPEIATVARGRCAVLLDSGIRRGSDVVKAMSLGAKAVLIGRPWVYGLGAAGEAGVRGVLEILRSDMVRTMQLMGRSSLGELDESAVRAPSKWFLRLQPEERMELGAVQDSLT